MTLTIKIGPNPSQQCPVIPNDVQGIDINSSMFQGNIRVMMMPPHDFEVRPAMLMDNVWEKFFSIQVFGTFLPQGEVANFDEIVFGIELNQPLDLDMIGVQWWLISAVQFWLNRMNSEIEYYNFVTGGVITNPLPSQPGACLYLPLVCAANNMHVQLKVGDPNAYAQAGMLPYGDQSGMYQQRMAEFPMLQQSSQVPVLTSEWTPLRTQQFPVEVQENTAYLVPSFQVFNQTVDGHVPPFDMYNYQSRDRRLLLRQPPVTVSNVILQSLHLKKSARNYAREFRQTLPYHPHLQYSFELASDYFDPQTFMFKPNLRDKKLSSVQTPPPSIANILNGEWGIDAKQLLSTPLSRPEVHLVCKNKKNGAYYFAITLAM